MAYRYGRKLRGMKKPLRAVFKEMRNDKFITIMTPQSFNYLDKRMRELTPKFIS